MSTGLLGKIQISTNRLPGRDLGVQNARMAWQDKLSVAMRACGSSTTKVAEELNVHANTARNYLRGNARGGTDPSPEVLWRLCQMFRISADWLLDDSRPMLPGQETQPLAPQEAIGPVIIRERTLPPPRPSVRKANAHGKRAEAPTAEPPPKRKRPASPRSRRGNK
jgi:transcriptional regulator with XRE-family HTH domain